MTQFRPIRAKDTQFYDYVSGSHRGILPTTKVVERIDCTSGAAGGHAATLRSKPALEWSQPRKAEGTRLNLGDRV